MKKWTIPCVDSVTRKTILLSDVWYNSACFFLEREVGEPDRIYEENGLTVFDYTNRLNIRYYYDEERAMLLKD